MSGFKLSDVPADSTHMPRPQPADRPLGLTVYSLPEPHEVVAHDVHRTRVGRWKMLLVMLVCAAPVIASYLTYYVIRPEARRVYGGLIDPQRPLPDATAVGLDGTPVNLRSLKGQWLLVSVSGGGCAAQCEKHLYLQRQIRESLGKEKERLDRVWFVDDSAAVPVALLPALKDSTVLRIDPLLLRSWLAPAAQQALADHLYLVDPLGNWMMRFPVAQDIEAAARAKSDIQRVLRASSAWDTAGR